MKKSMFLRKINHAMAVAMLTCFIMLFGLTLLIAIEIGWTNQNRALKITHDYVHFENHVEEFLQSNSNLMMGFSAYIQTFEEYNEDVVYTYLSYLTEGNIAYIRNIGIAKDTTIVWNFPKEGNEKAVGVDLSEIPAQAAEVEKVKSSLKYRFDGPIDLVQGGTGYVMRIPIRKNGEFWGMVSLVLKADKVKELFDDYAEECNLNVVIFDKSSAGKVVYGDKAILDHHPIQFNSAFSGADWETYAVSTEARAEGNYIFIGAMVFIGLLSTAWISRRVYKFFMAAEEIRRKNISLNKVIMKDKLTGIYNRSYLDERILEETELANRHGTPLSILFFDLDHFKNVNDTYGHSYGDMVLKEITIAVKEHLRKSDVFARWGGEEFAILMPATTLLGAVNTSEKIRAKLEAVVHPAVGQVTASFGAAEYFADEYIGSWFNRVDKALYIAKTNGRNTVSASEDSRSDISVQVKIKWTDEWLCGNESIDKDHIDLLKYGNALIESSYNLNTRGELIENTGIFIDLVKKHFENEENILRRVGYSKLDEHVEYHRTLIEKALNLRQNLEEGGADSKELFHYLMNEVVIGHLAKEDSKFFSYFREK